MPPLISLGYRRFTSVKSRMGTLPYRERSGSILSPKFGYCEDPQGLITLAGVVSPRTSQPRVLVLNVGYIKCYLFVKTKNISIIP